MFYIDTAHLDYIAFAITYIKSNVMLRWLHNIDLGQVA